ncbi:MAG TPA: ACT domain-containing protein [Firmicutes bacterium]|nr:ACT domain-containing protein [Bacillota bacterium]
MEVRQISVFLENKAGRLAKVTRLLGERGINIRALSLADTTDFGILRMIVNDPERAERLLKEEGFAVTTTGVLAVEVPDRPGGLADVLAVLERAGLNIEYLYAFVEKASADALVLIRVEQLAKAAEVLRAAGISVLPGERVYAL